MPADQSFVVDQVSPLNCRRQLIDTAAPPLEALEVLDRALDRALNACTEWGTEWGTGYGDYRTAL